MSRVRPRVLSYMRNKHFGFEELGEDCYRVSTMVEDTYFAGEVNIVVHLPEWEIKSIEGRIKRSFNKECPGAIPILQKVVGTRIGAGLTKKVDGLIGTAGGCTNMANIVLESCHMVVDGIHQHVDQQTAAQGLSRAEHRQLMLQQFPYLKHQCVRWSSESVQLERTKGKKLKDEAKPQPAYRLHGEIPMLTSDRSKFVGMGRLDKDTFWVQSNLRTIVHDFTVEMLVKLPRFEITSIQGKIHRSPGGPKCKQAIPFLQGAIGVCIERGLTAKIDEKVGRPGCPRLGNLVLENCHAVLQGTIGALLEDYRKECRASNWDEFKKRWLESMPMMKNSCLAYCNTSPLIRRLGIK